MPYTLNISALDLGGYYSAGFPTFTGSIVNASGGVLDTAVTTAAAPLTLPFASAAVPPATPCAMLVGDSGTAGDLVRTGIVTSLPPSPGTATVITVPPVVVPAATLVAAAAGAAIAPTMVPGWLRWLSGILTGGTYIPLVAVLPAPTVTLGSGTITVTVTGSLAARVFYFSVQTSTITVTATVTPAPSNDPLNASRVLRMPVTAASLLSAASAVPGFGMFLATTIASTLETAINRTIASTAATMVAGMGMRLTPSAVFNARRITVVAPGAGAGGINLQLGVSDLFGSAIVAIPRVMAVAISPTPQANTPRTYTVTVTDTANGSPIPNATVTLRNYDANGALSATAYTTDAQGRAVFSETLRTRQTFIIIITKGDDGKPEREREPVTLFPTLTAEAAGYNRVVLTLL